MAQIITQIEAILKDKYKPALSNQIGIEPSPFLEKIRKVPLNQSRVKCAAPIGINGGFGFGSEGLGTPKAGAQRYAQFEIDAVDMYVDLQISNKTVELASSNAGAMINALDAEIKGSYAAAKWNIGRALFGNGSGILCALTSADTNTSTATTFTVDNTKNLIEGLTVDIYSYASATASAGTLASVNSGVRIVSIDRATKTVTVDSPSVAVTTKLTAAGITAVDTYGFITVQGSYNKELCGLGAIFDSSVTSLYGLAKSANAWINPTVIDADNDLSDLVIYNGVKQAKDYKGADINLVMMGDDAFMAYQDYMHTNNVAVLDKHQFVGGAVGYKILAGSKEVIVVNERFVPSDEAWGVDTKSFYLEATPWNFMQKDGGIFVPMPDTSIFRALLASYGNLMCTNPGGCVRFTNCDAA